MKIILKSYPGHKGRPGKVGGSMPKSGSAKVGTNSADSTQSKLDVVNQAIARGWKKKQNSMFLYGKGSDKKVSRVEEYKSGLYSLMNSNLVHVGTQDEQRAYSLHNNLTLEDALKNGENFINIKTE